MSVGALTRVATLLAVAALLAGCTTNADADGTSVIDVDSGDDACELSATEAPAGPLTFRVENTGGQVTEFYLLGEDGLRIVGEVENVGPGLTRDLVLSAPQGEYVIACKPGMKGEGIRRPFLVTAREP